MNIRSKLKVLAGVTLVGLGLLSLATVSGLKEIGETEDTAHRRQAYAIDLVEIKAEAQGTILLDPAADETNKIFSDAEKTIERYGTSAVATIRRAEVRDELKGILAQWGAYDRASRELITLAQHDPKTANDRLNGVYELRFKPFRAALDKFIAARQNEATQGIAQARAVRDKIFWETVVLLVVVVVANVFVVLNLSVSLQSALNGIREKLVPLRAGDLTQRLPDRSADELGEIAAGVNAFIDELQRIVQRTRALSDHLAETSNCFAQAAESVSQGSAEQSSATAAAAAAVEQFSVSIDQVADNAAQAKVRSDASGDFSQRAGSDVLNAVSEIRHIETFVGQAAERMATLGQQARDISGIVDVIKEVADQTNLLALNAAIEAARAGEGGRGFAVVADEVRKLAERTSASAQEIVAMVTTIQTSTEEAHGMMRQTSELVVQGVRQIEQAGDSVQEINENSSGVVQAVGEISISLNEQRSAGTEIAASIERIAQMTEMGRNTASEVSETAKQLAQYADALQREVERFVV